MPKHFMKFIDNRRAIESRVLEGVVMHFLSVADESNSEALLGVKNMHSVLTENICHYYQDTMQHTEKFFNTETVSESWLDFQRNLILEIYSDYANA